MRMKIEAGIAFLLALASLACFFGGSAAAASSTSGMVNVSLVNQNPDPARAGEIVELRFAVENLGGRDVSNVLVELVPEYPFTAIPGEEYSTTIKTLTAYQTGASAVIVKYSVRVDKDAVRGTSSLKVRSWDAASSSSSTNVFSIEISGKDFAQIKSIDRARLEPGQETKLSFTVANIGSSPLQNLVFSWNEENGVILPVYSDDTQYIRYLDVGKSVELNYTVVAGVDAGAGLYQLDLKLEFETEAGTSKSVSTKAGIMVGGETDFDVTFSESSAGQVSLSVANTGNNPAQSVTVSIPKQESFRVTGSSSSIIGNLDKGDYTVVSFQVSQASPPAQAGSGADSGQQGFPAPGQRPPRAPGEAAAGALNASRPGAQGNILKVVLDYTDTTGVRRKVEKNVEVQFRSASSTSASGSGTSASYGPMGGRQSQGTSLTSWTSWGIIAALAVAGAFAYYKLKPSLKKGKGLE